MHAFLLVFIPLFVAIDPIGLVPIFMSVTHGMDERRRRDTAFQAVASASVVCIGFMFVGDALFSFLGISVNDFRIAGGVILLVLAVLDLLIVGKPALNPEEMVGVVPLGMPMIAGPATLTSVLVLSKEPELGKSLTALSLAINFLLLLFVLWTGNRIARLVGNNTLRAISKLVMVLLAAIAVNYIRVGVTEVIRNGR
jgi:multiple antibiotic resistance protein